MRLSLPSGAWSRVRPRSGRSQTTSAQPSADYDAACRGSHPLGDFTPRFTMRITPRPGTHPPAHDDPRRVPTCRPCFMPTTPMGLALGPTEASPSPRSPSPLGTAAPAAKSVAHHPSVNPGGGPILSWTSSGPLQGTPSRAGAPSRRRTPTAAHHRSAERRRAHRTATTRPLVGFSTRPPAPQPEGCGPAGGAAALQSLARLATGRTPRRPADLPGVLHLVTGPSPEGPRPRRAPMQEPGLWVHLGDRPRVAAHGSPLRLRLQR
jgi:hypothetical protein